MSKKFTILAVALGLLLLGTSWVVCQEEGLAEIGEGIEIAVKAEVEVEVDGEQETQASGETEGQVPPISEANVIFGFEDELPSWEIPDWCFEKDDYVAESIAVSKKFANEGNSSLEVMTSFPGGKWTAIYVEVQEYFDFTLYETISADVYLPADASFGLKAKFILTVGQDWSWIEGSRQTKLIPGEWTTITVNVAAGSNDWRRTQVTEEFRSDVRKLGLRVESNMRPVYDGPIYIDNVRLQ